MEKYRAKFRPRTCPSCGSARVAEIIYGLPALDKKVEKDIQEGRIVLGGCLVWDDMPRWCCLDCKLNVYNDMEGCITSDKD